MRLTGSGASLPTLKENAIKSTTTLHPLAPVVPSACFNIEEAAQQLRIGRTKVYDLIKEGQLASIKIGRRRVVPAAAIHALVEQLYGAGRIA